MKKGQNDDKSDMATALDYEVFEALEEGSNFGILGIGRPEDEGRYCEVNVILKDVIGTLAGSFDVVLIGAEAGVEQINRLVMKMLIVFWLLRIRLQKGLMLLL
ncbi:MAG: hypothetical protein SVJ22_01820 [Halobacteriota archaeon]|nr:hypothetical protein [Halobacteriota archaeon]